MKKIYLMSLTAVFALTVNAQTTKLKKVSGNVETTTFSNTNNSLSKVTQQTGNITSNTQYVAGTTMNLEFTLNLTNTDAEYGDFISITFPAGIVPNSSPNNPFASDAADPGPDGPEVLNPISGQTISWGNDDNNWGGIVANASYNFTVNVTITPGTIGTQVATYSVSGDGYGATPGDLGSGNVNILPAGSPDFSTALAAPIGITAINNCNLAMLPIAGRFHNKSTVPASAITVNYSVNNGTPVSDIIPGPIAAGDSIDFVFSTQFDFSPSNIYSIKVWSDLTGELNRMNDTASIGISNSVSVPLTTTTYSNGVETNYEYGSLNRDFVSGLGYTFALTATKHTGSYGLYLTVPAGTVTPVNEAMVVLPCLDVTSGDTYRISFWKKTTTAAANGMTGVFTGTAQTAAAMTTILKAYSANTPTTATAPWTKDSVDYVAAVTGTKYFAIGGKGTTTATSGINVRLDDIKIAKVGSSVGVKTIAANDAITIFPNPTSGVLNINAVEANSSVEVFNVIGEKVYSNILTKGNNTIDLSGLANGAYFVKLNSNNQIITKKVVLSK